MNNTTRTSSLPVIPSEYLTVSNGQVVTTSLSVAKVFGKRHDHVIRSIEAIEIPSEFTHPKIGGSAEPIFRSSEYEDSTGRKLPMYEMNRDGFTFLVMGFTGKKAAKFKWAYISAFNKMEKRLLDQQRKALPAPGLTHSQQRDINEAVRDKVEGLFEHKPLIRAGYMTIWHQIKEHFGVETYKDIPSGKIDELFEFIKNLRLAKQQLFLPPMKVFQGKDLHLPRAQIKSQIKIMVDQVSDGYLDFMWGCLDRMLRGEGFATSYDPNLRSNNRYYFLKGVP